MTKENEHYSLSPKEFAQLVGVSPSTVRRWEKEKVFSSVRTVSGYRRYSLSDVTRAKEYKEQVAEMKRQQSLDQVAPSYHKVSHPPAEEGISASLHQSRSVMKIVSMMVISCVAVLVAGIALIGSSEERLFSMQSEVGTMESSEGSVLSAETTQTIRSIISNIGWNFRSRVEIQELQVNGGSTFLGDIDATDFNLTLGSGQLTASNVLYSLGVGDGLSITGGRQNPRIANTGVLSINGQTGTLTFEAGSGISIDGTTISATDSTQNTFKSIRVGTSTINAGSADDSFILQEGAGISLNVNDKTITISNSLTSSSEWNISVNGAQTDTVTGGETVDFVSGNDIQVTRTGNNQLNFGIEDVLDTVLGINLPVGGYITGSNATITFDNFSVDASGNVLIAPGGDVVIGGTRLSGTGPASGATMIGVNGANIPQAPAGGTLQSVLENIAASIVGGSSKWTIASNVLYPNDYVTSNFAIGGTTPATSPFGVNINSNIVYIGDGANDANTPQILFKASDGASSGTLSYADGGGFVLTGGGVTTDGIIYAGSGVQAITLANGLLNPSAIPLISSGTTATTSSNSGLEVVSNQIGLIRGCSNGQVLKWNSITSSWVCSNDTAGSSAVTDVLDDGATPAGSPDSQFGSINFIQNFSLVENTSGVVDVNLASNVGIGTAPSGSYALTINGAANMTSLYLAGVQVLATANEINLLDGRSGTLLDTANVGTQLSGWDQNAGDDVTAFTGLSDTPVSYAGQGTRLVRVNAGATGLEFVDATSVGTNYWGRNSGSGYIYPSVLTDRVGIGTTTPAEMLDVQGSIAVSGTVDGRDISNDGSALDNLNTTIGLSALTSVEVDQLENIGATSITAVQWQYLGGMNQNVRTSDTVQFAGLEIGGATPTISSIVSGTGNNWSTASNTAFVTQEAIKDYVGNQISGSALTYENGLTQVGSTVVFGGQFLNNTRLYSGATELLYFSTSNGNLGIGTTDVATYKLSLAGDFNLTTGSVLRIAGTEILNNTTLGSTVVNSSLTGVGTIVSGTWQASVIGEAYGGTGRVTYNEGDLLVGNNSSGLNTVAIGGAGQVLTSNGTTVAWQTVSGTGIVSGTGTTNYLSRWINSSTLGDSVIYESGGNVGIGTASVGSFRLNVEGDLAITTGNDLYIGGIGLGSTATSSTSGASLIGFWGEGTLNYIQSGTSVQSAIEILDTQIGALAGGQVGLWLDQGTYITPSNNGAYAIFDNGRVGIGQTSAAAATLDVFGTAWLRGGIGNTGLFVDANGRVGLGRTDPLYALDSTGSINVATGNAYYINGVSVLSSGSLGSNVTSSSLTSVGTLTSGTWQASTITEAYGGTGKNIYNQGDLLIGNNTSGLNRLSIGSTGQVLTSNGTTATWQSLSGAGIVSGTGTANYLSRWINGNTLTNSVLYENSGNISIGTTAVSSYLLNIAGGLNTTALNIGGTAVTATASELNILDNAIVTTAELNYLDNSTVTSGGIVFGNGTNFTQDAANFYWADGTNRLGIGTTAPGFALDVNGNINVSTGNGYRVAGTEVLNSTTLGTSVVNSSLTSVGTITSGSWQAAVVSEAYGGTGESTYTQGDLLVGDAINGLTRLGIGTAGQVLTSNGTAPSWQSLSGAGIVSGTGTTGYLSRWINGNTLSNSNIFESGGNLGIGTTSVASYLLNVGGNLAVTTGNDLFIGGIGLGSTASSTTSGASLIGVWGDGGMNYITSGTTLQSAIEIIDAQLSALAGGEAGLWRDNTTYISPINSNSFAIYDNGRVGIGPTSVSAVTTLDVAGTAWLRGGTGNTTGLFVDAAGFVGFGKTNPSYAVDIAGSLNLNTGNSFNINGTSVLSAGSLGTGVTSSSLSSVGTITSGSWQGAAIAEAFGGTGKTSYTEGDLLVGNGSSGLNTLGIGAAGYVLTSNGTAPVWQSLASANIVSGSGTSGYVSLWNGSSSIGNSPIYSNGTNIGIGTTNAQTKLTISNGNSSATVNSNSILTLEDDSNVALQFLTPNTSAQGIYFGDPQSNSSGIIEYNHSTDTLRLGTEGLNALYIDPNQRIGIGNAASSPKSLLDVYGTAWLRGGTGNTGLFVNSSGNVGIGTTANNSLVNLGVTTTGTLTNIQQNLAYSALNIVGAYGSGDEYIPGLTFTTSDNNPTKPKAGIWAQTTGSGTNLFLGTSNVYSTGITNQGLTISPEGWVGIGDQDPDFQFQIYDAAGGNQLLIGNAVSSVGDVSNIAFGTYTNAVYAKLGSIVEGSEDFGLAFYTSTNNGHTVPERLRISHKGFLGVGNTAPSSLLTVGSTGQFTVSSIGTVTMANATYLDLGAITHATSAPQGLRLPQNTTASLTNVSSGEGYLAWSTDENKLKVFTGTSWGDVATGGSTLWTDAGSYIYADNATSIAITDTGRLGIGNTDPQTALDVAGTAWLRGGTGNTGLFVNSSGNVGIGTTDPTARLHVGSGSIRLDEGYSLFWGDASTNIYGNSTTDYLRFNTSGNEVMAITDTGNVGIGTTSPGERLVISGSGSQRLFITETGGSVTMAIKSASTGGFFGTVSNHEFTIQQNNVNRMVLDTNGDFYFGNIAVSRANARLFIDDSSGNVGIGTIAPGVKFQINAGTAGGAPISTGDIIRLGSGDTGAGLNTYMSIGRTAETSGNVFIQGWRSGTGTRADLLLQQLGGNVGIGTTSPAEKLDVFGGGRFSAGAPTTHGTALIYSSSSLGPHIVGNTDTSGNSTITASAMRAQFGGLGFKVAYSPSTTAGTARTFTDAFIVTTTGNVGIGTTAPSSQLDIFGTSAGLQLSFDANNYGRFTIGNDGTLTLAGVSNGGSLTNIARYSTTQVNFDVPTAFNAAGDVSVAYDLYFTNQTASYLKSDGPLTIQSGEAFESNDLTLETYGTGDIILKARGGNLWADGTSVGIGTTAPARAFHVAIDSDAAPVRFQDSNAYCEINPTTTTWSCTSDATLKDNVETLSSISNLERLNALRPVSFEWNTQEDETKRFGLIAQEVEEIFPEFVQTDASGLKTVSYGSFTPIIISALQEQQLTITTQQNNLDALNEQLEITIDEVTGNATGTLIDTLSQNALNVESRTTDLESTVSALAAKDMQLENRIESIEDRLDALEQASASASLDTLTERVGFLEQIFTGVQASGSADLSSYLADFIDGQVLGLSSEEATASALTVTGDTNLNNLAVTGEISSGLLTINGFDDSLATPAATISTLGGSLKLQHLGLGEIEFMGGKSKIDTDGNFTLIEGDLIVETGVIKGNDQIRGIDLEVELGETSLEVFFDALKDTDEYAVNITPNWLTNIAVTQKRTDGFVIEFSEVAPFDAKLDWVIIE